MFVIVSNEAVLSHPLYQDLLQKHELLQLQFNQLLKLVKGAKQERFVPSENPEQQSLFAKPEQSPEPVIEKITIERSKPVKKKDQMIAQGKRLPEHLRREVIVLEPREDLSGLTLIGSEESEQLQFKPGELYVTVTQRNKYVEAGTQKILIAEMPDRIKEKGILGNSMLAKVTTDKYVYHQPLYRQAKQYEELGTWMAVSTLSDGVSYTCDAMAPIYERLGQLAFGARYLQADETPIKILDPAVKGKSHLGYMWVYRAPQTGLVYFDYRKGRGREGPAECLKDFRGYLQTDGYQVYDSFALREDITLIGCMAHARRKFYDAQNNDRARAVHVLKEMGKLYTTEKQLREQGANPDQRFELRQGESLPVLKSLKAWLDMEALKVTPKSPIGQAMAYTLQRWTRLTEYLNDGILEIDNNLIENAIRPVALGRKNYLFAGSHDGAKRAAMMYSFFAMCKINDVPPMQWMEKTLDLLPSYPINRIEELLPRKNEFFSLA